jgi:hypothetical protein
MSEPKVARHGEHVKPHYAPAPGASEGRAGTSTDEARKDGELSGVVTRYTKGERASSTPIAMGWIKNRYADAIEYTSSPEGMRGLLLMIALWGAAIGIGFGVWRLAEELTAENGFNGFVVFPPLLFAFGLYMLTLGIRTELFRPSDEPTLFDRAHRKVYRVFRQTHPGIAGLFKPWPLRAAEYDWDLIDVEHQAKLTTTGSTVTRYHALVFIVKRSAADPTIIDSFAVGNSLAMGEQTVPAVWEHIRRFMEERGPHLPPGESLADTTPPHTLWQSLGAVGPFGPKYKQWWYDHPFGMTCLHLILPLSLPFFTVWGVCNWLSHKTATPIKWPQEILQAVGAPLR